MFDSIATLFSTPIVSRNYQAKPSLQQYCKSKPIVRYGKNSGEIDKQTKDIMQNLHKPIESWIIQKQPYLKCLALNKAIYATIEAYSSSGTNKKQAVAPLVHNLFVLVVQYKVLNERVKAINMSELQVMIEGLCAIYLCEEKGPLDELTCLLHFIISNSRMAELDNLKGSVSLFRPINIKQDRLTNFYSTFSDLVSKESYLDVVINIIPMMAQLCKVIVKTDQTFSKLVFLEKIDWLGRIGIIIVQAMVKDVKEVIEENQEGQGEIKNPSLRSRLFQKGKQLAQIQGIITTKVLFSFAYKELYFFQHTLKLHKYLMEIAAESEPSKAEQQRNNLTLVNKLLKAVIKYQFNLPDTSIQSIVSILSVSLCDEESDVCLPNLKDHKLQQFIEDLKCCHLYQPSYDGQFYEEQQSEFQFGFEKDESIVSSIIEMIFELKLEYLQVLRIIMSKINKQYLQHLQFYLIKNGFLHFLIEELQSIQSNDKKSLQNYFKVLALVLQRNIVAHSILSQIIALQLYENQKSVLVQYVRKNFVHARPFLFVILTDTISINSKRMSSKHFLPLTLRHLLYQGSKAKTTPKHDIWVSYIHDVIVSQLKSKRDKQKAKKAYYDEEINQWVMLAIIIHIEHATFKKGSDIEMGQFIMVYLTNMLKEAIKWEHQDQTQVMKNILKSYQDCQHYYTNLIQRGEDKIQIRWGPTINFEYLSRWNKKICKSFSIFIESVTSSKNSDIF